jgi:hypothetical protein
MDMESTLTPCKKRKSRGTQRSITKSSWVKTKILVGKAIQQGIATRRQQLAVRKERTPEGASYPNSGSQNFVEFHRACDMQCAGMCGVHAVPNLVPCSSRLIGLLY